MARRHSRIVEEQDEDEVESVVSYRQNGSQKTPAGESKRNSQVGTANRSNDYEAEEGDGEWQDDGQGQEYQEDDQNGGNQSRNSNGTNQSRYSSNQNEDPLRNSSTRQTGLENENESQRNSSIANRSTGESGQKTPKKPGIETRIADLEGTLKTVQETLETFMNNQQQQQQQSEQKEANNEEQIEKQVAPTAVQMKLAELSRLLKVC